ncbi:MAG: DUF883 family protein [Candidatus Binatia bacterium]|jgi:ElaB/YqjD/DUF883 family membrane-anchored ribosome-binding protein
MNEVTREKLTSDFKILMEDVQELLKATSNQTGESIADLRQRLGQKLEYGRKALSEQERALRDKAVVAKASAAAYLEEKPWATIGIAAGVGLLLGFLLRRRD